MPYNREKKILTEENNYLKRMIVNFGTINIIEGDLPLLTCIVKVLKPLSQKFDLLNLVKIHYVEHKETMMGLLYFGQ